MPLHPCGAYTENAKLKPYEFESSYYLHYYIICALHSIEMILNKNEPAASLFESESQYYHFYCDHLLFSLGQITDRFYCSEKNQAYDALLPLIELNKQNYRFNENDFPLLSDKRCRNTIEHIFEHNREIIAEFGGVGGFNTVSSQSDRGLIEAVNERREQHPYTLDLEKHELNIERNHNGREHLTLSLDDTKEELIALLKNVNVLINFLHNDVFI